MHPWTLRSRNVSTRSPAPDDVVLPGVLLAIVNARGTIDARTVGPFANELTRSISAGATRLLVDLSGADEIATACMNALLAARQRLALCGGRIAVVLTPSMRRRFEVLALDRRFLVADDRMQAARLLGIGDGVPSGAGAPRPRAHAA